MARWEGRLVGQGLLVIDIGKTVAKAVLCDMAGRQLQRRERQNAVTHRDGLRILDTAGVEAWLVEVLREFAPLADIRGIVPVGHGAAAAVVRGGALVCPPLDYEQPLPPRVRADYDAQRDPFAATGSPRLPDGLNLGAQLHLLEAERPDALAGDARILTWPQYWSWRLSGVAATEVSSLGCHTDLWRPLEAAPSALAERRGWAERLAPVRPAGSVLGTLRPEWAAKTGLSPRVEVFCGVHDSNAALLAARGFTEFRDRVATILSTGTWFVAMRSPGADARPGSFTLPEARDCLVNVDVDGRPVPSARFMGGREIQLLLGDDGLRIDAPDAQRAILAAFPEAMAGGAAIAPTLAPGTGPFPRRQGGWVRRPEAKEERAAAVALYAALVADAALDLVGARERLLIEGRFAGAQAFVRALATLRPETTLFVADGPLDPVFGACRLVDPDLPAPYRLREVAPLDVDLAGTRARWRAEAEAEGAVP
jgi:sugar (pentulose or hexulose) kinase